MKPIRLALAALFLTTLASALPARATIDLNAIKPDGFAKGVVFTVEEYAKTEDRATLTNFPVLVRISTGISGFNYADSLVSEGGDIRFADANGDPLPFEKDTWRGANDVSLFWVTLPRMTNGTEFAMFYGASQNDANAFANPIDTSKTPWGDYTGVWHLGDPGDGSGVTISDSTTNALTGATQATSSKYMSDGAIGGARKITTDDNNKPKEQISVSLSDSVKKAKVDALVPVFTVSLWYRLASSNETSIQWDYLIGRKREEKVDSNTAQGWALQMSDPTGQGGIKYGIRVWSCEKKEGAPPTSAIPVLGKDIYTQAGTWFKLDVVYSNSTYSLYFNGNHIQSDALKGPATNGPESALGIGGGVPIATGKIRPFTGDMDEVRLRPGTVSADWVAADYATQTSASFLSAGTVADIGASTKPIAEFTILDTGAAFLQVVGKVNLLGEGATECSLEYKLWTDGDSEPAAWTQFASGLETGEAATNFVVGLDPLTLYHYAFRAANDLATPEYSDTVSDSLTTSGVGDAGESGGASERQLDEFVHTFTITERGVSTFEFTPPTGVTSVEALVVAGGGSVALTGKIAVVTGGAQGFGFGIAQELAAEGATVVIADMNFEGASKAAASIAAPGGAGAAAVNIADEPSVAAMVAEIVRNYGGIDLFVANAGVLRAGSVKTLEKRDWDFVTNINYTGYFLCVKHVAPVMALQNSACAAWTDIVQVNSKSGLVGSNKNGAYAGGKFGTIGLTQSFALELVADHIKVNSVCPGNFFDGPLWSDPERGLFVQYLKAGKVPGAKTVADVKIHYEKQIPMHRGCYPSDVAKAIIYATQQPYETGQAIPVTGGQVMLN